MPDTIAVLENSEISSNSVKGLEGDRYKTLTV